MSIKVIAFDADDTLFVNETYFLETEEKFCTLMSRFLSKVEIAEELYKTQIANLPIYGYGIKGYILSMIETALKISNNTISAKDLEIIVGFGKEMYNKPIVLLEGVEETLMQLHKNYKLIVATKGDLLDQRRKLHRSDLGKYFHHIEVMTDKKEKDYLDLLNRLEIRSEEFLMVGNSLRSDVFPVLSIGGTAIHIPFITTWKHEEIDEKSIIFSFKSIKKLKEILTLVS